MRWDFRKRAATLGVLICAGGFLDGGGIFTSAWAEAPLEFTPPPQGLIISYDDGRTYTFGSTVDRLTPYVVTGPDLKQPHANMLRDVFFFAGEQTEHYRYGYEYKFDPQNALWPLDDTKVVRASYTYSVNGVPAGTGDLRAVAGSPEQLATPAGTFTVRRVMVTYESRPWRGEAVGGTAVCLYAPAVGYCVGLGLMEFGKPTLTALATVIRRPTTPYGTQPPPR